MRFSDLFKPQNSESDAALPTGQNNARFENAVETLDGDKGASRRKFSRRECDDCISEVNGQKFPVLDWSLGGLQISGASETLSLNDDVTVTMKFRLSDSVLEVPHSAKVVRRTQNNVGLEFTPLTRNIHDNFQVVVDDYAARKSAG